MNLPAIAVIGDGKMGRTIAEMVQQRAFACRPDPGHLSDLSSDVDGRTFLYEVVGRTDGALWGGNPYTLDSHLGTAAVHAGLVKPGLRSVVRVTVLESEFREYAGTESRAVVSSAYNGNSRGYRLDPAE